MAGCTTASAKQARFNAYLDDYAYMNEGLLALHPATNDARNANAAPQRHAAGDVLGRRGLRAVFHHTSTSALRTKNAYGFGVALGNLASLPATCCVWRRSAKSQLPQSARQTLELFVPLIDESPAA